MSGPRQVRSMPCTSCPYRRDVPSGLWAADEYDKLPDYDLPTADQPLAVFMCHTSDLDEEFEARRGSPGCDAAGPAAVSHGAATHGADHSRGRPREWYCHGWAVVHTSRGNEFDLLALRLSALVFRWDGVIPEAGVPLFGSGAEAAAHGKREIDAPSPEAKAAVARLTRKYPRLETGE